ncbi:MAG TPA: carboxypeptidase-like regulatory domain-containing protein [Candidatus Aquilonibacter sp.]
MLALLLGGMTVPAKAAETTTATISGVVTSAQGAPVAGAHVSAASPSGRYDGRTDAKGVFRLMGVQSDTYTVSVEARGFVTAVQGGITALPASSAALVVVLTPAIATIGSVRSSDTPIDVGATSERFVITANGERLAANASGLAAYTGGTVQGTIAAVPGVDLDTFGNAILRGGKVGDVVFDYDSVPVPQGLIAEPGGNIVGAQLGSARCPRTMRRRAFGARARTLQLPPDRTCARHRTGSIRWTACSRAQNASASRAWPTDAATQNAGRASRVRS